MACRGNYAAYQHQASSDVFFTAFAITGPVGFVVGSIKGDGIA